MVLLKNWWKKSKPSQNFLASMYVFSLLPSTKAFWQSLSKQFNHNCLTSFLSFFSIHRSLESTAFQFPYFWFLEFCGGVHSITRGLKVVSQTNLGMLYVYHILCSMYYQASTTLELQNIKDSFIIKVRLCAWAHSEDSTFWMVRSETSLHHSILFSHNFSFLHEIL